jgi:hypothetical protein
VAEEDRAVEAPAQEGAAAGDCPEVEAAVGDCPGAAKADEVHPAGSDMFDC